MEIMLWKYYREYFFIIIYVRATVVYVVLSNIFVGFKECKIGNSAT